MDANSSSLLSTFLAQAASHDETSHKSPESEVMSSVSVTCLLCDQTFVVGNNSFGTETDENKQLFLKHLLVEHKFVIADVQMIPNFKEYIDYWRRRFNEESILNFCTVIKTNSAPEDIGASEFYRLLCDVLPEDRELREEQHKHKLESVLRQQQRERDDTSFSRMCLFCREIINTRTELFNHMARDHSFSVGKPDNLVYTSEFLDVLDDKLHSLLCLYCDKKFRDRHTLKEHMRKKQHKKLNPKNRDYDKYYIINYKELGKTWRVLRAEQEPEGAESDSEEAGPEEDWGDWREEDIGGQAVCLFCPFSSSLHEMLLQHMLALHNFNLTEIRKHLNLNFYQQIKLVNYIRRQVDQHTCPVCETTLSDDQTLAQHLTDSGHSSTAPTAQQWDQPQYYFPTLEDDRFLCGLEDTDDVSAEVKGPAMTSTQGVVIAEDFPVTETILDQETIRNELIS